MNWYPVELHTHTQHSDGDFIPASLVMTAKQCGFCGIAGTDHNSQAGLPELFTWAEKEHLVPIAGIEWTTYWGHMLVLGEQGYTDWRGVQPADIDAAIRSIHAHAGVVGIAHPLAISNPVKTGYHWEFQVSDWDAIDFLEVWSRDRAPVKIQSLRAIELWEQLLDRGCHITATSGRDWHRQDDLAYARTYIGTEGSLTQDAVLDALRNGRVCLAMGQLLTLSIQTQGRIAQCGDTIPAGPAQLHWQLTNAHACADAKPDYVRVVSNGTELHRYLLTQTQADLTLPRGWVRMDLMGTYEDRPEQMLAMTNPVFVGS